MKCPLMHHRERNPDIYPSERFKDCFEEECAWWDTAGPYCSIRAIPTCLVLIMGQMAIVAKELTMLRPK